LQFCIILVCQASLTCEVDHEVDTLSPVVGGRR
jgi:hypothetical protein